MAQYRSEFTGAQIDALLKKSSTSLQIPEGASTEWRLVAISPEGEQIELLLGDDIVIDNGEVKLSQEILSKLAFTISNVEVTENEINLTIL